MFSSFLYFFERGLFFVFFFKNTSNGIYSNTKIFNLSQIFGFMAFVTNKYITLNYKLYLENIACNIKQYICFLVM